MTQLRVAILIGFIGLFAIIGVFAAYSLVFPPFTDAEIQQSFVDTWGVNAIITIVGLAVVLSAGGLSALLSWRGTSLTKRLSIAAVMLSITAAGLLILAHAALTERTTKLTGQEFGGILGLGLGPI
jgi:hypothetical protein